MPRAWTNSARFTGPWRRCFRLEQSTSASPGVSSQLRISLHGSTTIVSGDVNGDRVADFEIGLLNFTNLASLTGIDFLK
jgi:hypothetical protein